jgi:hypothetical protein
MTHKHALILALAATVLTIAAVPQQEDYSPRRFLKGLGSVYVLVEHLSADAEQHGLTRELLKTDAELRLRQLGMHVADSDVDQIFWNVKNGGNSHGYLYIQLTNVTEQNATAYSLKLALRDMLCTRFVPETQCFYGDTWKTESVVLVSPTKFRDSARDDLKRDIDEFMNDYLAVNPPKK